MKKCFLLFALLFCFTYARLLRSTESTELETSFKRQDETIQLLIELSASANVAEIEELTGFTMGTYMGKNTYIIRSPVSALTKLQQYSGVKSIGQYKPKHKFLRSEFISHEMRASPVADSPIAEDHAAPNLAKRKTSPFVSYGRPLSDSQERLFIIHVLLEKSTPKLSRANLATRATQVSQQITNVLESNGILLVRSIPISESKITLSIRAQTMEQVLYAKDLIALNDNVHVVQMAPINMIHNQWARLNTQTGFGQSNHLAEVMTLQGQGQIVGVGDSGLEAKSCYFYDNKPYPIVNATPITTMSEHRKIHGIWPLVDNLAEDVAHGTHVSGTVLGNAQHVELAKHNGMAPQSKLLFVDIGCTNPGGCRCNGVPCECDMYPDYKCPNSSRYVWLPLDLNKDYFPFFYKSQSRIQTNSWGGGAGFLGYSSSSKEIDQFTWEHKDFTVLFSAGNSGDDYGYSSLGTQAEAKNAIAVGASMNSLQMFQFNAENVIDFDTLAKRYADLLTSLLGCGSTTVCYNNGTIDPNIAKNKQICEFLKTFNTEADCCSRQGPFCNTTSTCGCSLYSLGSSCCRSCYKQRFSGSLAQKTYNQENLAYFSSRGPTVDGRIKPDVLAPGYSLLSARSVDSNVNPGRTCQVFNNEPVKYSDHLASMGGTSMSCPTTAGNVALVRQYYTDGWYNPTEYVTKPSNTAGFIPSSALIKATLVDSGRELDGYLDMFGSLVKIHASGSQEFYLNTKFVEGFGLIQLHKTLNNKDRRVLLGRRDGDMTKDPIIKTGQKHAYCIQVGDLFGTEQPLKVSLVWTDYPASPASAVTLVNNLDLVVRDSNDDLKFGNSDVKNSNARDSLNNVEQVVYTKPKSGEYVVIVEGTFVPEGPQDYALIISGQVKFRTCRPGENETVTHVEKDKPVTPASDSTAMYFVVLIGSVAVLGFVVGIFVLVAWIYIRNKNKSKEVETKGIPLQETE